MATPVIIGSVLAWQQGACIVGAIVLLLIAITVILDVYLKVFPWYTIIAALTVIPVEFVLRQATGDLKHYLKLMASNVSNPIPFQGIGLRTGSAVALAVASVPTD